MILNRFLNDLARRVFLLILSSLLVLSCSVPDHKDVPQGNKFDDQAIREIYDLQDKRDTQSLLQYFNRQEADYRREAALAMGSVQDSLAIPGLIDLLHDEYVDVRLAAAYSLGQIKNSNAEEGLMNALEEEDVPLIRRELWESLGKCSDQAGIKLMSEYRAEDSLEREGLAWALYRIGLRGLANPQTTGKAAEYLSLSNSYLTRLGGSHYLSRTNDIDVKPYENEIAESALKDPSPFVRMSSARALAKCSDTIRSETIKAIISDEPDPRVLINATRSLIGDESDKPILKRLLAHPDPNVSISAATFIASHPDIFREELKEVIANTENWRARSLLMAAAADLDKLKDEIINDATERYINSTNTYEKASLISVIGKSMDNHSFIWEEIANSNSKAISTAGISALLNIRRSENFDSSLGVVFTEYFKKAILTGDQALVEIASRALRNPDFNYKVILDDHSFLDSAKSNLTLPKDNETLQSLERTIAYFKDEEYQPVINEYNHPINWDVVKKIPENQRAIIHTSKGRVIIELYVNESPGSVENFYSLASNNYYDGKVFHRVVPNFVIQGGCPRGDGFGGEDYSIRSELGPIRYKTGSVGMASAGKDTEGVQWFITHSPTPHLDGAYSIFGQVVDGMNIVNAIEVGDVIEKIEFPIEDE